jgi:hypothetical protein
MADPLLSRTSSTDPVHPFPWAQEYIVFNNLLRNGYLAMQFTVPADVNLAADGILTHGETMPGPMLSAAISPICGDFNPPQAFCHVEGTRTGQRMLAWKLPNSPRVAGCNLQAGHTYYLNIKMTDPTEDHFECNATSCQTSIVTNHN